jgi:DUF1680 family protein
MTTFSRRVLLKSGAACATAALTPGVFAASSNLPASTAVLQPARYGDVTLSEGPLRAQFEAQHATLLAMDDDALLKPFRAAAGMAAPGADLGGWYSATSQFNPPADMHGFIPGHSFGQYLSGLARAYAITGDAATKEKVVRLVAGYAPTVTPRFYDGYTLPAYTFDKLNIGLIDAHEFAGEGRALDVLNRTVDAALPHLPEKALTRPEMTARPHPNVAHTWDESYTLPENFYLAWKRGAGERFRGLARRFLLDKDYFDPLARGENVLPGKHAYSHMNALSSAMQAWLTDGSAKHFTAARNGLGFVLAQSFATGGWGPNERFYEEGSGALGQSLDTTHASFETPCGAYGHFKATRYLISATGDSRYGDSMERVLYNTVLGALPMKPDGTAFYYSDYNSSGSKAYFDLRCPCCSGTIGQVVADYGISAYFTYADGIAINLYVPSRLRWQHGVVLEQVTDYPLGSAVEIAVQAPSAQTFAISLRIPEWAGPGTTVAVNGKKLSEPAPGRFYEIRRTWQRGDRITLALDMPIKLEQVDAQHPDLVAVTVGPLALFATGDRFLPFRHKDLLSIARESGATWRIKTEDGTQTFKPFFAIGSETTRLYQSVAG